MSDNSGITKKWYEINTVKLALAILLIYYFYVSGGQQSNYNDTNVLKEMKIIVSTAESQGFGVEKMDADLLKKFEVRIAEELKNEVQKNLVKNGFNENYISSKDDEIKFEMSSDYLQKRSTKLGLVRANNKYVESVFLFGVQGSQLVTITCLQYSQGGISITEGPCAKKIKEIFGISAFEN
jgi:hypothetical protein